MVDAVELGRVRQRFRENAAGRALLKGLGFAEIGIHRRHERLDGLWRDCVIVERLLETGDGEHKG
jgi:RimJ/RimL family protein N-acetyltransferase